MRESMRTLILMLSLSASWGAFGAGGGGMPSAGPTAVAEPATPEERARSAYQSGIKAVERGDRLLADAARQTDLRKQAKLRGKAHGAFDAALRRFSSATQLRPTLHEAWNYVGYCHRKLGDYEQALTAYDRALALQPAYAEAIEYRGHAYLGLNRIDDAKRAYLVLFGTNRQLAASLLAGMQQWLGEHRGTAGVDAAVYESFSAWVRERSDIATQTAGLTREGADSAWR